MCVMDHYFDFVFVPVCLFFSHFVLSLLRRFCLLFQESVQIFDDRKCINYFIAIEAEILLTFLSIQGR